MWSTSCFCSQVLYHCHPVWMHPRQYSVPHQQRWLGGQQVSGQKAFNIVLELSCMFQKLFVTLRFFSLIFASKHWTGSLSRALAFSHTLKSLRICDPGWRKLLASSDSFLLHLFLFFSFYNNVIGLVDPQKLNPPFFCMNAEQGDEDEPVTFLSLFKEWFYKWWWQWWWWWVTELRCCHS